VTQLSPEPPYRPDPFPIYRPAPPRLSPYREAARKLAGPIGLLVALALKFKTAALVVLKFKLFATSATMLVSFAAYWWLWGWRFALGFVGLLFVHELGHVWEARRQGLPVSAPMFVPFLGALITLKQMPHNVWREARIALAGPIVGGLAPVGFWIAGEATGSDLLVAIAFTGFLLNLFNLLPIVPLDGGRAVAALHPALWGVGLVGLLALALWRPNPIVLLILFMGGLELWSRWRHRGTPAAAEYYRITPGQRLAVGVTYIGLAALLGIGMSLTHLERTF
jgi:Zn-dependent protease